LISFKKTRCDKATQGKVARQIPEVPELIDFCVGEIPESVVNKGGRQNSLPAPSYITAYNSLN
jgi:hypothetical protein